MGFKVNNNSKSAFVNAVGSGRSSETEVQITTDTNDKIDAVAANLAQVQSELTQSVVALSDQISSILAATTQGVDAGVEQLPITVSSGHNMIGYTGVNGIDAITAFGNSSINAAQLLNIDIIKNSAGQFYAPQWGVSLLSMQFGQGYYIFNAGDPFTFTW